MIQSEKHMANLFIKSQIRFTVVDINQAQFLTAGEAQKPTF